MNDVARNLALSAGPATGSQAYPAARSNRKGTAAEPRLVYVPRDDATPEGELAALAAAYAFVIRCHEEKKAAAGADGGQEGAEHGTVTGSSGTHAPIQEDTLTTKGES